MRKPTIDELYAQVGSLYELTMLAAREATRIRLKDPEAKEPLQQALERIAEGKVKGRYLSPKELEEYERKETMRRDASRASRERVTSTNTPVVPVPPIEEHEAE
jgi:DNA-directed RNA polymerase omega subunit